MTYGRRNALIETHTPVTACICMLLDIQMLLQRSTSSTRYCQGEEMADTVSPCSNLVIHSGTMHVNEIRATVSGAAELRSCNLQLANCMF